MKSNFNLIYRDPDSIDRLGMLILPFVNNSISHGTLIAKDIIDKIIEFIVSDIQAKDYFDWNIKSEPVLTNPKSTLQRHIIENYESEMSELLNEDIFQIMNEIAPLGYYFGAHIGDGSDFGFWEVDMEEGTIESDKSYDIMDEHIITDSDQNFPDGKVIVPSTKYSIKNLLKKFHWSK